MTGDSELERLRVDLAAANRQITELVTEFEETNHGLIALHAELEQARHAEAQLAAIVQSSDDAMYSFTPDLVVQIWNAGAERLLGYPADEIVGRSISTVIPDELADEFHSTVKRLESGDPVETYETRRRRKDGELLHVAVTTSAIRDNGGVLVGFSAVARDITRRLLAEEQLAVARADQAVLAEQQRIARDMHDHVIQRIFAAGMAVQAAAGVTGEPELKKRLELVVDDLDATISDIRTTILAITSGRQTGAGLRAQILDTASSERDALGFNPAVRFHGPVDTAVPNALAADILAVIREALSNIARHAHASSAVVTVTVGDEFVVQIDDNGRGLGETTRRSGLANLRQRADALGGTFDVVGRDTGGTRLTWQVPIGNGPVVE